MNSDTIFRQFDKADDIAQAVSGAIACENCGEPTSSRLVGDERYDYCNDCNWVTH